MIKKQGYLYYIFSAIVFAAVMVLSRVKLNVNLGFDVHLFAKANAIINSCVAVLLVIALIAVKSKNYTTAQEPDDDGDVFVRSFFSKLYLSSFICRGNKVWRCRP